MSNPSTVSTDWLADNLEQVKILDGSFYLPAEFLVPGQPGEIPGFHLLSSSTKLPHSGGVLFVHPQNSNYWTSNIPKGRTIHFETGPWLFDSLNHTAEPMYQIISW